MAIQWERVVDSCFRRISSEKRESLVQIFRVVDSGLRVAHLIDILSVDQKQAESIARVLVDQSTCLVLLQFSDRYTFLCNKEALLKHIRSFSKPNAPVFIAVQDKEPLEIDPPEQLDYWLHKHIAPCLLGRNRLIYSDSIPTCMVALVGFLLEYPVVYTTHDLHDEPTDQLGEWEVKTNCLGYRLLNLVEVWVENHLLMGFSYPPDLVPQGDMLAQELELKINERMKHAACLNQSRLYCGKKDLNSSSKKCRLVKKQVQSERFAI
ncbi:hypothetical protein BY458DRAFT_489154 [Sporodiniella umbellata]|nr:hypothetical protein BY458DRAFT_489154 [Sporodiniella umbellata]